MKKMGLVHSTVLCSEMSSATFRSMGQSSKPDLSVGCSHVPRTGKCREQERHSFPFITRFILKSALSLCYFPSATI